MLERRVWTFLGAGLICAGCLKVGVESGAPDGAPAESTAGPATGAVTGVNCGTDPNTGVILCSGISSCEGLLVDTEAFPFCGFRVNGPVLDLECVCGDALCPIGPAATCEQAQALLASSNEGAVCAQLSDGVSCTTIGAAPTTGATSTSSGGATCDQACATDCAGVPDCLQFCGC